MVGFLGWDTALAAKRALACSCAAWLSLMAAARRGRRWAEALMTCLKCPGCCWPRRRSLLRAVSFRARRLALALATELSSSRRATRMGTSSATIVTPGGKDKGQGRGSRRCGGARRFLLKRRRDELARKVKVQFVSRMWGRCLTLSFTLTLSCDLEKWFKVYQNWYKHVKFDGEFQSSCFNTTLGNVSFRVSAEARNASSDFHKTNTNVILKCYVSDHIHIFT